MTEPTPHDRQIARIQRNAALVILGTFAVWLPAQGLAAWLDLPVRLMGLLDLVALAALAWALILLWRVRRMRRKEE
ncbi:hypothetical protein JANAI62_33700 [Jannaschia pagri]|uniref:Uncharacterized protein n=1 Tax=Jannaschia pagri TaxID=2829797 RepID=A0ABQ4NRP7_9RHOB|nr:MULTISPECIES: DUF5337 family protein [unclassified Jannaschia]GIT92912.1 hypothetical protein JANAI61_33700 [Jannaschia sp. AI_61]GIT96747.1 hypothetical protein JANAI62_33700 [Jannaschia sp. AI_62]